MGFGFVIISIIISSIALLLVGVVGDSAISYAMNCEERSAA